MEPELVFHGILTALIQSSYEIEYDDVNIVQINFIELIIFE